MRELKRSIAHALMEGVPHPNRKTIWTVDNHHFVKASYFSLHWREYINHYVG